MEIRRILANQILVNQWRSVASHWRSRGVVVLCGGLALLQLAPIAVEAQTLYAYRSGARGTITFTSKRPSGKNYWVVKKKSSRYSTMYRGRSRGGWRAIPTRSQYDGVIQDLAKRHQLEPALVKAVVHVESAFRPKARSHAGAQGLMQLMPGTAKRFGVRDPYHPVENIQGGVRYLRWLYRHFNGNLTHVLAGYNAGENAVKRYGGVPPYAETREYVRRVLQLRDMYRCDYNTGRGSCGSGARRL